MTFNPVYKSLETEGCDLHYWYQGTGPLITFIPGGNGHGRQYNTLMALLSPFYTCATFDRRQMSASVCKVDKMLSLPQQARDVAAVIKALGFTESIIFGSSLGGIIAFQFAIDFPAMTSHLISHEAPTFSLLPDSTAMYDLLMSFHDLYLSDGVLAAQSAFGVLFVGYNDEGVPATTPPEPGNPANFWKNEFLPATYTPDLRKIVKNGTSVAVMVGERSGDACYARTTIEHQEILGCVRAVAPGHHQGFEAEPEAFMPGFVELLRSLEERKLVSPSLN